MKTNKQEIVVMTPLTRLILSISTLFFLTSSVASENQQFNLVDDPFPVAQAQLREVVQEIANDVMRANIKGLQEIHLVSDKFTKFGPRSFDRQDVTSTNASEAAFFSSISDVDYSIHDLKIDVFGEIGIVTYYPRVSFIKEGDNKLVNGRQTLVFLNTKDGWKIVHEHGTVRP